MKSLLVGFAQSTKQVVVLQLFWQKYTKGTPVVAGCSLNYSITSHCLFLWPSTTCLTYSDIYTVVNVTLHHLNFELKHFGSHNFLSTVAIKYINHLRQHLQIELHTVSQTWDQSRSINSPISWMQGGPMVKEGAEHAWHLERFLSTNISGNV